MSQPLITADTLGRIPTPKSLGVSLRRSTTGPEYELVQEYLHSHHLPPTPRGQECTIFLEPRLASGFPDIVLVYWHVATTQSWSKYRANLTSFDLRVLHYLVCVGAANITEIQSVFTEGIGPSLERLYTAELIRYPTYFFEPMDLHHIFAVYRLIAIEAKVDDWRGGLAQALQNTWFASESYVLLPQLPRRSPVLKEAAQLGIGVVTADRALEQARTPARPERLPKSYTSWLFNEWVWRLACQSNG